ncbi:MAG: hypothetical protein E4H03_07750 [Myxococcales bacterium]|nr:MAG: hypothetical protein E4H03_07750 [Myxococcales bacterium]
MSSSRTHGLTCHGGRDRDWHHAVLDACPSLRDGYRPTRWARNAHVQNLLTMVHERRTPLPSWDLDERLEMSDGGTVSVQWLGLDAPSSAPVVVVLHTLCGSADGLRRFVLSLQRSLRALGLDGGMDRRLDGGWTIAACNRRGHAGLPLTAPVVNTMGSTADLRSQLAAIEARRPGALLYAVGVSAGSGLLVRYLGEQGSQSRLRAAVALCPAYDIRDAFDFVHPRYDAYLTRRVVEFFLARNRSVLGGIAGYEACAASRSMSEFHACLYPLAGYTSAEAYFSGSNPMEVALDVATPTLVINAADDPVCVERNVHHHLGDLQTLPRMTLALTRHGGHCGFYEGPLAGQSWSDRAVVDYLTAAHRLLGESGRSV